MAFFIFCFLFREQSANQTANRSASSLFELLRCSSQEFRQPISERDEGRFGRDFASPTERATPPLLRSTLSRSASVWLQMIRMPSSFCSMEAIPVTHEETCETCKSRIVGVRNHRRGTFVDLCLVHFEMLAEQERAAYDAIESMPFRSDPPKPRPAHV
jgi:hypothetical protein